ncbi:MAG TPA: hypothetical protein VFW75_04235 [Acetobacteraceae bacterium]|nr:hypothetical protein [Acetobacteraceae bacterium]
MAPDRRSASKTGERQLDDTIEDSFPASDPPAHSGVTGTGHPGDRRIRQPQPPSQRGDEARPAGTPNADRHATETAHQREDEELPQQKHPT